MSGSERLNCECTDPRSYRCAVSPRALAAPSAQQPPPQGMHSPYLSSRTGHAQSRPGAREPAAPPALRGGRGERRRGARIRMRSATPTLPCVSVSMLHPPTLLSVLRFSGPSSRAGRASPAGPAAHVRAILLRLSRRASLPAAAEPPAPGASPAASPPWSCRRRLRPGPAGPYRRLPGPPRRVK